MKDSSYLQLSDDIRKYWYAVVGCLMDIVASDPETAHIIIKAQHNLDMLISSIKIEEFKHKNRIDLIREYPELAKVDDNVLDTILDIRYKNHDLLMCECAAKENSDFKQGDK